MIEAFNYDSTYARQSVIISSKTVAAICWQLPHWWQILVLFLFLLLLVLVVVLMLVLVLLVVVNAVNSCKFSLNLSSFPNIWLSLASFSLYWESSVRNYLIQRPGTLHGFWGREQLTVLRLVCLRIFAALLIGWSLTMQRCKTGLGGAQVLFYQFCGCHLPFRTGRLTTSSIYRCLKTIGNL